MKNQGYSRDLPLRFNPLLLLGVPSNLQGGPGPTPEEVVRTLATHLDAVLDARQRRPWATRSGPSSYSNAIGDLPVTGIFRTHLAHDEPPALSLLEGDWDRLS
jgi:hypothetical protein